MEENMIMEENIVVIIQTIFLHTGKSKTNDPHKIVLNLSKGLDLRSSNKLVAFQNLSIYYTWGNTATALEQYTENNISNME